MPVNVFMAGYWDNAQGRELVSEANTLIPDAWRQFMTVSEHEFAAADGRLVRVNEVRVQGAPPRSLVWYWYAVGAETATAPATVKLQQAYQLIVHGRSDGSAYLLHTPLDDSLETSRLRLETAAKEVALMGFGGHEQS
jgi:EpsI family protein